MRGRPRTELTPSDKKFIDTNWNHLTYIEMMDKLNLYSVHKVREYCQIKGYKKAFELSEKDKTFIRENYSNMSEKDMADELKISTYHVQKFKASEGLKRKIWIEKPEDETFFIVEKRWNWVA